MRHILFIILLASISFISCNNDIDLNETFKEIPVVYGILNPQDTAQYIRLERVFNDPETSALLVAQNPDSIYYSNASVFLNDNSTGTSYKLEKIDANNDNFPRDTGIFAQSPNYLYKIKNDDINIEPGKKYTLIVLNNNGDTLTSAYTNIVSDLLIYIPSNNSKPIKLPYYYSSTNVSWTGASNASYFDVFLIFNIEEKNTETGTDWTPRQITWKAGEYIESNSLRILGSDFYQNIGLLIETDPNIKRRFLNFDIKVRGVGPEMKELRNIININTGITSSQSLPTYTNLSYGYGIFTSINSTEKETFLLDELTRDSLKYGIYTKDLNFE